MVVAMYVADNTDHAERALERSFKFKRGNSGCYKGRDKQQDDR